MPGLVYAEVAQDSALAEGPASGRALDGVVTFIALLQMLHRLERYYAV